MRWTQFFERFEYSVNLLITNMLYLILPFSSPKITLKSPAFSFLFRYSPKTADYTLLNILPENSRFLP